MSISPESPCACTAGTPATGAGSSTPFRMMRRRPPRSVTSMSPPGRNARPHGREAAGHHATTLILCPSAVSNVTGGRQRHRRDALRRNRNVVAKRHSLLSGAPETANSVASERSTGPADLRNM